MQYNDLLAAMKNLVLYRASWFGIQMGLKIASYVESDYRPSSWLAFMLTSKPAGKDALLTMLPRMDTDNVVLTQNKHVIILVQEKI